MTKVYLVRHAEAEGNIYRRFHGWYNSLITDNGYRQIAALAKRFEGERIDAVYSSNLFRTMTTAGAVYKSRGLELNTDPGLREIGGGVWEDKPWGQLRYDDRSSLESFNVGDLSWQVEGSETYGELQNRVCGTILKLAAAHEGQTIALFSHGTAIRSAIARFSGLPAEEIDKVPHGDNTCVACLNIENGQVEIVYYNDNSHLGELSTLAKQSWWKKKGSANYGEMNLWFRPMDFSVESDLYCEMRREAWKTVHGTLNGFDEKGFLLEAKAQSREEPHSIVVAMQEDKPAGLLQVNLHRDAEQGVGDVPFYYLTPEARHRGLGVQLLGEAISIFRPLGRDKIRLRCARNNEVAQHFYRKFGFVTVGEEQGAYGPLDVLEKYIGYEDRYE